MRHQKILLHAVFWTSWIAFSAQAGPVGLFEGHDDIGSPRNRGSAAYNGISQEYALTASGANMWDRRDEFHFLWRKMRGDFILRANIELLGEGVDPHRKLGWMVRKSLDEDSPYADACVHGDGLTSLQYRREKGAITEQVPSGVEGPDVIQLERKGNRFLFSAAVRGRPFTQCELTDLDLGGDVYAGLFLCAHNPDVTERAVFRNVRIIRPAREDFVPYRDYIGSRLETLEVGTGKRQLLFESDRPLEAPNWTPDGNALIYNTSGRDPEYRGRLYRFDLMTRASEIIDTDFANRNNNDHVLSFDGTMLAISHHSEDHDGGSAVYTMPVGGGVPRLITPQVPSYLHGWSPDGKWLVYTGGRDGEYDIFKIQSDGGGKEINLTRRPGLDDGPEYAPDGEYIYFNSSRSGRMQIWRMKPDGGEPTQITDDEYNNWFPHVSPDGKWIAFLSYAGSIDADDHPYYKQVYLRMMSIEGGEPTIAAYVYGGQGTMNVPSWSPDGSMLAFVSNSDGFAAK